jgi:Zn-dependent protease
MPIFGGAKPVPFNPNNVKYGEWGAAFIAIAGPLINFVMAFVFYGLWVLFSPAESSIWYVFFAEAVSVNLAFFVFNLIPIPPLDGSRVLYALAPDFARRIMESIEQFGIITVFLILAVAGPVIGQYMNSAIYFFFDIFKSVFGA